MKAILLCAGFGTRLYPLTRHTAKPLLEVAGRPIVEHLVEKLGRTARVEHCVIVSNARFYAAFQSWAALASESYPSIGFEVLNDGAPDHDHRLGAVRDLASAVVQKNLREAVLVAAADNLYDGSFDPFFEDYYNRPRNLVLAYRETDRERLRRTGVVEVDETGRIGRFREKPDEPPPEALACPAFYILEAPALARLHEFIEATPDSDAIGGFIAWLAERQDVYVHEMTGHRLDIGNIGNYRAAEAWFRKAGGGRHAR